MLLMFWERYVGKSFCHLRCQPLRPLNVMEQKAYTNKRYCGRNYANAHLKKECQASGELVLVACWSGGSPISAFEVLCFGTACDSCHQSQSGCMLEFTHAVSVQYMPFGLLFFCDNRDTQPIKWKSGGGARVSNTMAMLSASNHVKCKIDGTWQSKNESEE